MSARVAASRAATSSAVVVPVTVSQSSEGFIKNKNASSTLG